MRRTSGFTIVELLVIVVVIAILAAMVILGYGAWQHQLADTNTRTELTQASSSLKNKINFTSGSFPVAIDYTPQQDVTISYTTDTTPHYSGLSTVQKGVLFYTICGDLISEGYGVGTNNGGQTEQYISACNVYNYNQIQINSAWHGHNLSTSVQATALSDIANSINYNDSWRPNEDQIEKTFYNTWNSRFLAEGGSYPISSFWDPWATSSNGGVLKQELPQPDSNGAVAHHYCLNAVSVKYPDIQYSITDANANAQQGPCAH